jgi:anti-sigma regulatory factor (Ser/Thr protein kinase)/anti-anti-sigma regulatory factor
MTSRLGCVLESSRPVAVVRLSGPLGIGSSLDLRTALQKALAEQPAGVVIDIAGLTVKEDIALTVFSAFARTAAAWPGCRVVLCAAPADARAALDRLAISQAVQVLPDRAQALAAVKSVPAPRRFSQRLSSTPAAIAVARHTASAACLAWRVPYLVADVEAVVSELVSNGIRHAGGDLQFQVVLGDRFLHVSVRDSSHERPRRLIPDPETEQGGRGLMLVEAIAASWGSTPTPDGKVVWATLRLAG